MRQVKNETCRDYLARRLAEGWRFTPAQGGNSGTLSSPDGGARRSLDLGRDVETLRPSAAGDETGILNRYPSSGDHYDKMDETSSDGDSTYVTSNNANAWERDLYSLPSPTGSGVINKITVYAVARNISGVYIDRTSLKVAIKTGGTVYEGGDQTMTTSYQTFSREWATNPATGSAWTWADIEALQIGLALRRAHSVYSSASRGTQVYVEVDYSTATPKTAADSGSGAEARASGNPIASLARSDGGSGAEGSPAPAVTLSVSESGGGMEVLFRLFGKLAAESAMASEMSRREVMEGAKSSSDSGSGTEIAITLRALLSRGESGSSAESLSARLTSDDDTGSASEVIRLLAALIRAGTGSGIDATAVRLLITGEGVSGVESLSARAIGRADRGSASESGGLEKMLLAADGGAGIETIVRLLLASLEHCYGTERRGARTMTRPGASGLRLYPDKGGAGIPSKEVNSESSRNANPGETGPEGRSHSLPLGG